MWLNESSRDNLLQPYVDLYNSRVGAPEEKATVSQMKQFLLRKFVNEAYIRNLSMESNYYLAGVARYYFNGDLTTNKVLNVFDKNVTDEFIQEICQRLNALILVLRNAYIDTVGTQFEQPEDFGTLSIKKLLRKYNKAINAELGVEEKPKEEKPKEELNRDDRVGNGYTFDILYSFEDARKYNKYTEPGAWCITYGQQHYDGYVKRLGIHYVIFRKDGYESLDRKKGQDFPRDEYGSSLIALLQSNRTGNPTYITSRWNHGANDCGWCEADHAFTKEQFMAKTGVTDEDLQRIFKIWKTDTDQRSERDMISRKERNAEVKKVTRILKYVQMLMNEGNFETQFGDYADGKQEVLLTNRERYNQLRDTDENGSNKKAMKKVWKNSLVGVSLKISDGVYYAFLIDRGKVIFNSMVDNSNSVNNIFINVGNLNIVAIRCGEKNMYYDLVHHKIIDIDGVTKFKHISNTSRRDDYHDTRLGLQATQEVPYYLLGDKLNKWAMLDAKTNDVIVLPNGSSWAEDIQPYGNRRYSTRDKLFAIDDGDNVIRFVYDSASGEEYYYERDLKKFIDIPDGWILNPSGIGRVNGVYTLIRRHPDYGYYYTGATAIEMKFYKNGEPYQALPGIYDGMIKYSYYWDNESDPSSKFLLIKEYNSHVAFMFDFNTEEKIPLPEGTLSSNDVYISSIRVQEDAKDEALRDNLLIIAMNRSYNRYNGSKNRSLLFSVKNKKFLINPYNNQYIFKNFITSWGNQWQVSSYDKFVYFTSVENFKCEGHTYFLDSSGEFKRGDVELKRNEVNEIRKVNITERDIKKMVSECIKNVLLEII